MKSLVSATLAISLALAAPAFAWTPGAEATQAAAAGKVWVDVSESPTGAPARGRGVVEIDAPPTLVWKIMNDCAYARRIMPNNRGCRVVERDPAGKWEVREQIMKTPILPDLKVVFRSDLTPPKRMVVNRVSGDVKILQGEWRLEPLDGGKRTRVIYEMHMQPSLSAPGMLIRAFVRGELNEGLSNLRREVEQQAS